MKSNFQKLVFFWVKVSLMVGLMTFASSLSHTAKAQTTESLDLSGVQKIYFILASPKGMTRSSFGHAYLRLSEVATANPKDRVIEFVADTPDADLSYLRAMGFGKSYARRVVVDTYQRVQQTMNFSMDRTLTSYEVLLNDKERRTALALLEEVIKNEQLGKYTFFSENCASAVSEIFAKSVHSNELRSIVPNRIPRLLKKYGRIGKVMQDLSLTERREKIFEKYRGSLSTLLQNYPFLGQDLMSKEMVRRIFAYSFINKNMRQLDLNDRQNAQLFLKAQVWLEPRIIRDELVAEISRGDAFYISEVQHMWINPHRVNDTDPVQSPTDFEVQVLRFRAYENRVQIEFQVSTKSPGNADDHHTSPASLSNELRDVAIKGVDIFWKDLKIGVLRQDTGEVILTNASVIYHLQNRGLGNAEIALDFRLLMESESTNPDVSAVRLSKNKNPLLNRYVAFPACYGLVDVQKALYERAVFDGGDSKLDKNENLELFDQLLNGAMIVVPGFDDASSWIQSMKDLEVMKRIRRLHLQKYSGVTAAIKLYLQRDRVYGETILALVKLANKGVFTPIHFRIQNSPRGHAILLLGAEDRGSTISIKAYDPNIGIVDDLFIFDKVTQKMKTPIYGPSIDIYMAPLELKKYIESLNVTQGASRQLLIDYANKTGRRAFSFYDFTHLM